MQSYYGPLVKGEIADYYLDENTGILYSYSRSVQRTVDNIRRNAELVKQISGNRRVPTLVYLSPSPVPDRLTRQLSRETLPLIYTAVAMVSKPQLSSVIMRVLFSFQRPRIPVRTFTNADKAIEWLKKYPMEK